jgi:hypothetical protein
MRKECILYSSSRINTYIEQHKTDMTLKYRFNKVNDTKDKESACSAQSNYKRRLALPDV